MPEFVFNDGTPQMPRFPLVGDIHDEHAYDNCHERRGAKAALSINVLRSRPLQSTILEVSAPFFPCPRRIMFTLLQPEGDSQCARARVCVCFFLSFSKPLDLQPGQPS